MITTERAWAILVVGRHADLQAAGASGHGRMTEVRRLLDRAATVAPTVKTCAVIAARYTREWEELADDLPSRNVFVQLPGVALMEGISRAFAAIRARDANAHVVLIPADHCSPVESSWVESVSGALRLSVANLGTIYMLHDKPQNDPRPQAGHPGMCSSSVLVGSIDALLELCHGRRAATIVDLMVEDEAEATAVRQPRLPSDAPPPLNVIHVSSVEEYARLQRGRYTRPASTRVDMHV